MKRYRKGQKVNEGKTKVITADGNGMALVRAKDDITAGNGRMHDIIPGKGAEDAATTCNVFRLLQRAQLPVAFQEQVDETRFLVPLCDMLLFEVVIRREAHGSYLSRHPHIQKRHVFPKLIVEFYLKTSGEKWKGRSIPVDDPFAVFDWDTGTIKLYRPDQPIAKQEPFAVIPVTEAFPKGMSISAMQSAVADMVGMAKMSFLVMEKAWQIVDHTLVDFKVEFGITQKGQLLLADVIDNGSWRLIYKGKYRDKQIYRDTRDLEKTLEELKAVRKLTEQFQVPRQRIVVWTGSKDDDTVEFRRALIDFEHDVIYEEVVCSAHKDPVGAYVRTSRLPQDCPDTVVIAYIGRSNGAGPTLSANTILPVITVPKDWKAFPANVWSSLDTPSLVPVMTALYPKNAILAALQFLAARNAVIYAKLRYIQEERLPNVVLIN